MNHVIAQEHFELFKECLASESFEPSNVVDLLCVKSINWEISQQRLINFFPLSKSILLSRFIELFLASPSFTKPLYSYRFSFEETGGSDEIGKYKFLVAVNDTWGRYETKQMWTFGTFCTISFPTKTTTSKRIESEGSNLKGNILYRHLDANF